MRRHALLASSDIVTIGLVRGAFADTARDGDRVDHYPSAKHFSKFLGDVSHVLLDLASTGASTIGVRYLRRALMSRPDLHVYVISRLPNSACLPEDLRDKITVVTKDEGDENVTRRSLREVLAREDRILAFND